MESKVPGRVIPPRPIRKQPMTALYVLFGWVALSCLSGPFIGRYLASRTAPVAPAGGGSPTRTGTPARGQFLRLSAGARPSR